MLDAATMRDAKAQSIQVRPVKAQSKQTLCTGDIKTVADKTVPPERGRLTQRPCETGKPHAPIAHADLARFADAVACDS
jgi:hypothetical protein